MGKQNTKRTHLGGRIGSPCFSFGKIREFLMGSCGESDATKRGRGSGELMGRLERISPIHTIHR